MIHEKSAQIGNLHGENELRQSDSSATRLLSVRKRYKLLANWQQTALPIGAELNSKGVARPASGSLVATACGVVG
jgi:hypothetical protein